ncbi:hypothetical protein JRO89_XSUnG0194100 [Xanthoceras sorbifolium]|uniref:RING-type E3 ubiquitin transferase n=1 Tax=Xanthoceras sorbifolium TaxID=99658 RepID=A0ABQ8GXB9_9ROSI|nr:hypothetical protein JRO89_XSUnG0194100 [Xanthoceras sorbifolium]
MSSKTSFSSTKLFQDFLGKFHSRKLLQFNPLNIKPITAAPSPYSGEDNSLDSNVVMVLSFILCATICSICLHFLINCIIKSCSSSFSSESRTDNSLPRIINKGIKQKALKTFPVVKYSADLKLPGLDTECVICLSEFATGERVRLLPKCNHGFHVRCIDKWLRSHSSCPKCRNCLIETCQKVVGCSQAEASPSDQSTPFQETVLTVSVVVPLEPECMDKQLAALLVANGAIKVELYV